MTDSPRSDLDRRLRETFAPDPAAVARVSAGVDARSRRSSLRTASCSLARVATLCVAGGAIVAALVLLVAPRVPAPEEPGPVTRSLSGSFTDGLLVVPLPDGSVAITGGEARRDRPEDGYGFVLVQGELR